MTAADVAHSILEPSSQGSLVAAMMRSEFYPKPPGQVTHKETHISHLFFAGDLVYKVKKAIRFSFLDYSSLAKRRHYLQEELSLNRRLAPSVYLGVMPIAFDESGWRLGGWAEPGEYTLVMRRLPEKRMLRVLLDTHQASAEMMQDLAKLLAGFHSGAERVRGMDPNNYLSGLQRQWSENLSDLEPFLGCSDDLEALNAIRNAGAEFIAVQKNLLQQRVIEGWIRDVHGDLHAEHICFAPEGIQIFDCLEFSAKLRRCDLASEIAFLLMDVTLHGGESLRAPFLAQYRESLSDPDMPALLPFFECYRALVRAKVHALRVGLWNDEAARYFRFAQRFDWARFKPFLVMICGFSGAGKSTLAQALAERVGLPVFNSDVVRKNLSGIVGRRVVKLNHDIYGPAVTEGTYARMAREAEKQILMGNGAILDATFVRKSHRERIARLAARHKIPLLTIHCWTTDGTAEKRLRLRAAQGMDVSDACWDTYVAQKIAYEPIQEFRLGSVMELDTGGPLEQLVGDCERFLRSRLS